MVVLAELVPGHLIFPRSSLIPSAMHPAKLRLCFIGVACRILPASMKKKSPMKPAPAGKKKSKSSASPLAQIELKQTNYKWGFGANSERVGAILKGLDQAYPQATCALKHDNPFQLLISTILSAQCTDERVNQVTASLYKKYPSTEAFAYATPSELEQDIRPTGFFRNKTKSIMGASRKLIDEFKGEIPQTMEQILTL